MKSAYEIANNLSKCNNNNERENYCHDLMKDMAKSVKRRFKIGPEFIQDRYGNNNLMLKSRSENPFLITAHYDAVRLEDKVSTVPGANDNGSGVGVALEAIQYLKDLPVNVILFGSEEESLEGSFEYISNIKKGKEKMPVGVLNLDCVGSGNGILIPKVSEHFFDEYKTDDSLNSFYRKSAKNLGYKLFTDQKFSSSDHVPFIRAGIPATIMIGKNDEFLGDNAYHTINDNMNWVNKNFLEDVVKIVVDGTKKYFKK